MSEPTIEEIVDTNRLYSAVGGQLLEFQIKNLKALPLVAFGENLENEFTINFDRFSISFVLKGKSDQAPSPEICEAFIVGIKKIIGKFDVEVTINGATVVRGSKYVEPSKDRKRKKSKSKRKKTPTISTSQTPSHRFRPLRQLTFLSFMSTAATVKRLLG